MADAPKDKKDKTAYEGQDVTTISLDRARIVKGTAYGPGQDIRVPKKVADALKAEDGQATTTIKQGKGPKK